MVIFGYIQTTKILPLQKANLSNKKTNIINHSS